MNSKKLTVDEKFFLVQTSGVSMTFDGLIGKNKAEKFIGLIINPEILKATIIVILIFRGFRPCRDFVHS